RFGDEERLMAWAVRGRCGRAALEVLSAGKGKEGGDLFQKSPPHLLITDCTMPRMDGLELCRRIRMLPGVHDMPIYLLTARGLELDPFVVNDELRISKVVLKPFSPRELFLSVQETLKPSAASA